MFKNLPTVCVPWFPFFVQRTEGGTRWCYACVSRWIADLGHDVTCILGSYLYSNRTITTIYSSAAATSSTVLCLPWEVSYNCNDIISPLVFFSPFMFCLIGYC